jgi:hypothetical protein
MCIKEFRVFLLLLALLALALTGCAVAPSEPGWAGETSAPVAQDAEPWRACLLDRPVCVEAVYCEPGDDDPRCAQAADGACLVHPVWQGAECFDGAIGHCDGKGACK